MKPKPPKKTIAKATPKKPPPIQPCNRMIWHSAIGHHVTTEKTAMFPYQFRFFA